MGDRYRGDISELTSLARKKPDHKQNTPASGEEILRNELPPAKPEPTDDEADTLRDDVSVKGPSRLTRGITAVGMSVLGLLGGIHASKYATESKPTVAAAKENAGSKPPEAKKTIKRYELPPVEITVDLESVLKSQDMEESGPEKVDAKKEMKRQLSAAEHQAEVRKKIEKMKLPSGALWLDADHTMFAMVHPTGEYEYIEASRENLVRIMGIDNTTGELKDVYLQPSLAAFYDKAKTYFEQHAPDDLVEKLGFMFIWGHRTIVEQNLLRKQTDEKYKDVLKPGQHMAVEGDHSVHVSGFFADMYSRPFEGTDEEKDKLQEQYFIFWYGTPEQWKDPNFVPPVVRMGGLPTEINSEPWHVGAAPENIDNPAGDNKAAIRWWKMNRDVLKHPYPKYKGPALDKPVEPPLVSTY